MSDLPDLASLLALIDLKEGVIKEKEAENASLRAALRAAAPNDTMKADQTPEITKAIADLKAKNANLNDEVAKLKAALRSGATNEENHENGKHHVELVKKIKRCVASEVPIVNYWDIKRANIGIVVHDKPELIVDFLFKESTVGVLRRDTLQDSGGGAGGYRILFWQHYLNKGKKIIEYILQVKLVSAEDSSPSLSSSSSSPLSNHILKLTSIKENNLPRRALRKLSKLATTGSQRAKIEGELRISSFAHSQSTLTWVGTMEAEDKALEVEDSPQRKSSIMGAPLMFSNKSQSSLKLTKVGKEGDMRSLFDSIKGILEVTQKQFHKPDSIDSSWFSWREMKTSNGKTVFMVGFVPLSEYVSQVGSSFAKLAPETNVLGESSGVYFFEELASNVCRVTRIQT
ncbi:hypothetical protein TrRE_jg10636, partial [Triparma retinervis]